MKGARDMSHGSLEHFKSIGRHFVYSVYITDLLHSADCTIGMYKYFVKLQLIGGNHCIFRHWQEIYATIETLKKPQVLGTETTIYNALQDTVLCLDTQTYFTTNFTIFENVIVKLE